MSAAVAMQVVPSITRGAEPVRLQAVPADAPVRSTYRGQGMNPVALAASLAIVAGVTVAIAAVNAPVRAQASKPLTVFSVDLMPPPPPEAPPPPAPQAVAPPAAAVAPVPVVVVPRADSPVIAVPPPPVPMPVAITVPPAPPAPPAAPAVSGPIEGADLSARMISATPPGYPDECRRRREQGIVKLLVLVGLDGRVQEVSVAGTSGFDRLDRAAQGAVKRWRWSPVRRDGEPVMVRGVVTIPFVLRT